MNRTSFHSAPSRSGSLTALALFVAGCAPSAPPPTPGAGTSSSASPAAKPADEVSLSDALVQFSLISSLAAGDYSNGAPLQRLLKEGNFGVGTFDNLDGELILLDGELLQAQSDGTVRPADPQGSTPFAAVTFFNEDGRIEHLDAATLDELDERLDRELPRPNLPYALRIDGEFRELTLRSVPVQKPPFQPLVEVVKHQTTWKRHNVRGTLIGLRCPAWIGTVNVSGYHWHFLASDKSLGGHVLGCEFRDALLRYDDCHAVVIHLPQSDGFDRFRTDQVKKEDINAIERERTKP